MSTTPEREQTIVVDEKQGKYFTWPNVKTFKYCYTHKLVDMFISRHGAYTHKTQKFYWGKANSPPNVSVPDNQYTPHLASSPYRSNRCAHAYKIGRPVQYYKSHVPPAGAPHRRLSGQGRAGLILILDEVSTLTFCEHGNFNPIAA